MSSLNVLWLQILGQGVYLVPGVAILVCVALSLGWRFRRAQKHVGRDIAELINAVSENRPISEVPSRNKFKRFLSKLFEKELVARVDGKKFVVSEDPVDALAAEVAHRLESSDGYKFAGSLTGIALLLTFFFISLSVANIGQAIKAEMGAATVSVAATHPPDSAGQSSAMAPIETAGDSLGNAIGSIAAKFLISALGIFLTLVYQWWVGRSLRRFLHDQEHKLVVLRSICISRDSYDLDAQLEHGASLRELVIGQVEVAEAVRSLVSIDVSVKSLGQEVIDRLRNMISSEIGESVERILQGQREQLEQILAGVAGAISNELGQGMNRVLEEIKVSMNEVANRLDKKGENHTEALVKQLVESLQGNIGGSAQQLNSALSNFVGTIPEIQSVLTLLVTQMREHGETSKEISRREREQLVEHLSEACQSISTVTETFGGQFASFQSEIERTRGQTLRDIESANRSLNETAVSSLKELGGTFNEQFASLSTRFESLKTGLELTLDKTSSTLGSLEAIQRSSGASIQQVQGILGQLGGVADRMSIVSQSLTLITDTFQGSPQKMREAVEEVLRTLNVQKDTIQEQGVLWKDLMAQLIESVASAGTENAKQLKGSFETVQDAYSRLGGDLSDSIKDLSDAVRDLKPVGTVSV